MQSSTCRHRNWIRAVALLVLSLNSATVVAQTTQERVHEMSDSVMPFDVSETVHVFEMTESGGVQRVIARDPGDSEQVMLIREHLEHEAGRFADGDYSDPGTLHGEDMPGLEELQAGAARIEVSYAEIDAGAEIAFRTSDLQLVTAVHRWFGAQLSEHGADARAE